jgi:hypothetical protein
VLPSQPVEQEPAGEPTAVTDGAEANGALHARGGHVHDEVRPHGPGSTAPVVDGQGSSASPEASGATVDGHGRASDGSQPQQDAVPQHGIPAAATGSASGPSGAGGSSGASGGPLLASLPPTLSSPLAAGSIVPCGRVADPPTSLATRPETSPD